MAWGSLVAESMSLLGHGEGFGGSSIRTLSSREAENLGQYYPTVHCYHEWENQFLDDRQFFFRKKKRETKYPSISHVVRESISLQNFVSVLGYTCCVLILNAFQKSLENSSSVHPQTE